MSHYDDLRDAEDTAKTMDFSRWYDWNEGYIHLGDRVNAYSMYKRWGGKEEKSYGERFKATEIPAEDSS